MSRWEQLSPFRPPGRVLPAVESDPGSAAVAALQPFRGPFQRWPRFMDTCLAGLAFMLTLQMMTPASDAGAPPGTSVSYGVALLLALLGNLALIWRRRRPLHTHALILVCAVLALANARLNGIFGLAISLYSLGRYTVQDRASVLGMLLAILLGAVDMFVIQASSPGGLAALGFMFLLWYAGRRLRFRGEYLRLLEERARYLEQSRSQEAERAVAEERTRIARELHDVVAHQVSLMTVQAGAAKTVAKSDPEAALAAMGAVEHAGRQALAEMRHLLDVLRREPADGELAPQPGCADLLALAAEVKQAGTEVELETSGRLSQLPPRLDLALYRIAQEALTNVIKHAGTGARARVRVEAQEGGVMLSIRDNGVGASGVPGRGFGIAGMRERADLLGGRLNAEAGQEGGFTVEAFLPLREDRA